MRRFERMHENRVNMRRNTRTCFLCGKMGHIVADYPKKVKNKDSYKHMSKTDGKYRSRRDHKSKHKDGRRSRKKESRGRPERWLERATSTPIPRTPPRARAAMKMKVIIARAESRPRT
jgi:hypothetical protein